MFVLFHENESKIVLQVNLTESFLINRIQDQIGENFISSHFEVNNDSDLYKIQLIKKDGMRNQNANFMEAFKQSYKNMITEEDMLPINQSKNQGLGIDIYPQTNLVNSQNFSKFELDTLFTIFYFSKDKNQRYMASKELKTRQWRFNKKYLIWFIRHGQPVELNSQYEKGDFLVFDNEEKWKIKKKTDFYFEYKHLENEF